MYKSAIDAVLMMRLLCLSDFALSLLLLLLILLVCLLYNCMLTYSKQHFILSNIMRQQSSNNHNFMKAI